MVCETNSDDDDNDGGVHFESPLHAAVCRGSTDCARLLLKWGVDVDAEFGSVRRAWGSE